jgi:hypothetical protein
VASDYDSIQPEAKATISEFHIAEQIRLHLIPRQKGVTLAYDHQC